MVALMNMTVGSLEIRGKELKTLYSLFWWWFRSASLICFTNIVSFNDRFTGRYLLFHY